jgi:hypothetical protein
VVEVLGMVKITQMFVLHEYALTSKSDCYSFFRVLRAICLDTDKESNLIPWNEEVLLVAFHICTYTEY